MRYNGSAQALAWYYALKYRNCVYWDINLYVVYIN